jgi:hypothetical protein
MLLRPMQGYRAYCDWVIGTTLYIHLPPAASLSLQ